MDLDTSSSNIERIRAIVHPDTSNRQYRDRFQADMDAPAKQRKSGASAPEHRIGERVVVAVAHFANEEHSESDYGDYFLESEDKLETDEDDNA